MNIEYPVVYCILSGTKDGLIAMNEAQEIDNFNALNSFSVKYVRRTRSILYKYGQYLDFIMLLNGHKIPILYTEDVPSHVSGEVFEPSEMSTTFAIRASSSSPSWTATTSSAQTTFRRWMHFS
jgi:hypothetical protein